MRPLGAAHNVTVKTQVPPPGIYVYLSSGRYPENDFKTFLTITILEIIYIVCQLGKISERYVL